MTRGDFPAGGSPEAVAKWFGFASEAELEASHARYAEEMTASAIAEELAEAQSDDPWAEPEPAPVIRPEAAREYINRLVAGWSVNATSEPEAEADFEADYDAEAAEYDVAPEAEL